MCNFFYFVNDRKNSNQFFIFNMKLNLDGVDNKIFPKNFEMISF